MSKLGDIPIVEIGPGTQNRSSDEMDILKLPTADMPTFNPPILPEPEETVDLAAGKRVLESVLKALQGYTTTQDPTQNAKMIDLAGLNDADLDFVNQAMGEGEVSLRIEGKAPIVAQESVLAGVWRVQYLDAQNQLIKDTVEISEIPHCAKAETFLQARDNVSVDLNESEQQLMNAPSLLVEIHQQLANRDNTAAPHVINLTLLPLTEQELEWLGYRLGVGPTTILSRGYGNCRIGSTNIQNVWWIKYYNSEDTLILNTIELCGMPEVACAAPEDLADSAHRLDEILELYR